jgi:uncharacterized damage-inducible protein DinB
LFDRAALEFDQALSAATRLYTLEDTLPWTDDSSVEVAAEDQLSYAVALAQMVDHGIHHRAQVCDMLRLLGYQGPTDWHPFEWEETVRLNK